MYSIRLELGRQAEDLEFTQYQEQLAKQAEYEEKMHVKSAKLAKHLFMLSLIVIMLILCIVFVAIDISKYKVLTDIREEIAKRPVITKEHPIIDTSYRDMIEEELRIEEEKKSMSYSAVENDSTVDVTSDATSEFAIVVDINNDTIRASRKAKTRISPASMTKIMTVLVAAENIKEEDLDDTFAITSDINYYSYKNDCSAVGFADDEVVTVRDLFYGTILPSGADAAVGLATYVAGSQEAFVELMNQKLETLGLSDTAHFTNCVGLFDENHYCTCYDMAMILRAAIENPLCKEVLSTHVYTTSSTPEHPDGIEISNWFLRRIEDKPCGGEVMCAKTGYVSQSGNCAASFGTDNNGNDFIVVTGNSIGSWRCIYDHVAIYRQFFPGYDSRNADTAAEQKELEGDADSNNQSNGGSDTL